jgi:CBS domain-containing protein
MGDSNNTVHGAATAVLVAFLEKLWPFAGFGKEPLEEVARGAQLGFFAKDSILVRQDSEQLDYVYLIERGAVRLYREETDGTCSLADYRGEGSLVGVTPVLSGLKAPLTVETVEDTFCYLLDKGRFLEFVRTHPIFAENYFRGLSESLVGKTYSQLRTQCVIQSPDEGLRLANASVSDAVRRQPETIDASQTIHEAAQLMTRTDISVLLVKDPQRGIVGTLSDKDLRAKVVARRADYDRPVSSIMTSPPTGIAAQSTCLDAVLQMMKDDAPHLVVTRGEDIIGVVSPQDILASQEVSPLLLLGEIDRQPQVESLCELGNQVPRLVRNLVDIGAKAHNITRIISVLNDHIAARLLALLQHEIGPPPVPFCWMVMGSEGRMEQTLRTDQDNAIVYQDPGPDWEETKAAKLYFRTLGNRIIESLVRCGYPLCKGGYMASKTVWRKPYSVWTGYFDEWMSSAEQEVLLNAKIFLDFRCGFGSEALAGTLRDHVTDEAARRKFFLNHLAKDSLTISPPLSFFRNFIVESGGDHKNRLDLKMRGLVPVVDFARAMSLKYRVRETNTTGRLDALQALGHVPQEICSEVLDAYHFLMHLRLVHQLRMIQEGQEPHNFVDPTDLSDLEKQTLKGAFGVIRRMQSYMAKVRVEV